MDTRKRFWSRRSATKSDSASVEGSGSDGLAVSSPSTPAPQPIKPNASKIGPAPWEMLAPMAPSFADRLSPMLDAEPAHWLASHRDPTLSLAPLSHFVMDSAPAGNVELLTTPFLGSSVIPEAMTEIELDMALADGAARDDANSPEGIAQSQVWIPRLVTSARPKAGSPRSDLPKANGRPRAPQRSMKLGAHLTQAREDAAPPISRKSDLADSPGGQGPTSGVSGGWSAQGDWVPLSGATKASGWTQSLTRSVSSPSRSRVRASSAIGGPTGAKREGSGLQPIGPNAEPPAQSPPYGQRQHSDTATAQAFSDAPGQLPPDPSMGATQIRGSMAPAKKTPNPSSTATPTVRPEVSGGVTEVSQRGLVGGQTDQESASRSERHGDGARGAGSPEASNVAVPPRDELVPPRTTQGIDEVRNDSAATRSQNSIAIPRPRLGLGEPMHRLPEDRGTVRPAPAAQGSSTQSTKAQPLTGQADLPAKVGGASVVYSKRALGKMTVTGSIPALGSQYPVFPLGDLVPRDERSQETLDLDSNSRPNRPMVANRSMSQGSGPGSIGENSAFTAPGLGEVSLHRDAMADDRLAQTKALGLAKGKDIDLAGQLGSLSNPRALGVFAHEMTHLYQQQALGNSRMPMAGTAEFRLLEAQAESVRHSVENSPTALIAGGGTGAGVPPHGGPASSQRPSSGSALPPRALAVARVASAAMTRPGGQQLASSRDATSNNVGARTPSGPINTRPKAQTVYSPVAGAVAAAGGAAGSGGPPSSGDGQPFMGLSSFFKKSGGDKSDAEKANSKKRVPFTESELNFLYRELLHRIKNQLRWEADRTGNMNRFFKD